MTATGDAERDPRAIDEGALIVGPRGPDAAQSRHLDSTRAAYVTRSARMPHSTHVSFRAQTLRQLEALSSRRWRLPSSRPSFRSLYHALRDAQQNVLGPLSAFAPDADVGRVAINWITRAASLVGITIRSAFITLGKPRHDRFETTAFAIDHASRILSRVPLPTSSGTTTTEAPCTNGRTSSTVPVKVTPSPLQARTIDDAGFRPTTVNTALPRRCLI